MVEEEFGSEHYLNHSNGINDIDSNGHTGHDGLRPYDDHRMEDQEKNKLHPTTSSTVDDHEDLSPTTMAAVPTLQASAAGRNATPSASASTDVTVVGAGAGAGGVGTPQLKKQSYSREYIRISLISLLIGGGLSCAFVCGSYRQSPLTFEGCLASRSLQMDGLCATAG